MCDVDESGLLSSCKEFNEDTDQTNDFSLEFINSDPNENFIDDGTMEDYSNSSRFEVVEEIKVNHGLFVSTCQVADTFFHQLVPSQIVQVHLNPVALFGNNLSVAKSDDSKMRWQSTEASVFAKLKAVGKVKFVEMTKSMKAWWTLASAVICTIIALLLMNVVSEKTDIDYSDPSTNSRVDQGNEKGCSTNIVLKKIRKRSNKEEKVVSAVNIRGGNSFSVFLKKMGIFLTISFALCTMWANHNMSC